MIKHRHARGISLALIDEQRALHRQESVMRTIKTSAVLAAAFVGLFVGSASAQETVVAKVPFPFVVRGEEFAAGRYQIRSHGDGVLLINGMDNKSAILVITIPADGRDPIGDQPSLVFTRLENVYRLSQIWEDGTDGRALQGLKPGARIGRAVDPSEELTYVVAASWK